MSEIGILFKLILPCSNMKCTSLYGVVTNTAIHVHHSMCKLNYTTISTHTLNRECKILKIE